jgi:glycosyltransferase involved in cell wall biosynthesis
MGVSFQCASLFLEYRAEGRTSIGLTRTSRVEYKKAVRFEFIGGFSPDYQRNAVIRKGLARLGAETVVCRAGGSLKAWARYPLLFLDAGRRGLWRPGGASRGRCLFVPEFCAKDVPLAKLLSVLHSRPLLFDPLAARFETKVIDWGRLRRGTPQAWWNFKIDQTAFRLADLILADTAAHKEYYCAAYGIPPQKVAVLPLGYDDDAFRPSAASEKPVSGRPPKNTVWVLFYGSFLPLHGTEIVAGAARLLQDSDPPIRFRLIGEGRTLASTRRAASEATNVMFTGRLPIAALARAVEAADICLGIFGGTEKARRVVPHKIYQAMGLGRPVVTLRTPAVEEFFTPGENIVFCAEPTAESLARSVLILAQDAARRERIGRAGYALVRRDFTPEAVARRLVGIVRERFGAAFQ